MFTLELNLNWILFTDLNSKLLKLNSSRNENYGITWWYCPNGCGRKYVSKGNARRHFTLECGVPRQFKCSVCGKACAQKEHLKTHMILVHKQTI